MLQDTFVIALQQMGRLRDPQAVAGWLMQIAVRLAHRRCRRRRLLGRLGFESGSDATLSLLARAEAGPETVAELALLDRMLRRVSAAERIAWMLRYVEGLSLQEAASSCRVSLATIKRRIARADATIRRHVRLAEVDDG